MSKVQMVEAQLQKLSPDEMREVRDWLDEFLQTRQYESSPSAALTLREEVQSGVEQVRAGKASPFDAAAVARIKARGRKLLAAKR